MAIRFIQKFKDLTPLVVQSCLELVRGRPVRTATLFVYLSLIVICKRAIRDLTKPTIEKLNVGSRPDVAVSSMLHA